MDAKIGARLINARGETLASKPAFREAFRQRRCLIPASGFYEWQEIPGSRMKQPHYVSLLSGELMTFAGLWESWKSSDGEVVLTCTIVTTGANQQLASLHDRMPAVLGHTDWNTWLDPDTDRKTLETLIRPYPADEIQIWPVSTRVNRAKEDSPDLIKALSPP